MVKVKVDENLCIGCGTCEALCPNVFKVDMETGKSKVIADECGDCNCQEAIDSCPVSAISMVKEGE
ncbi:MAG: ferredoxin [Candidatus Moranbacteria bacterium]|jgi:ferredoxin|nr:ferredoxin [Candidatus Moranbacteria bacterium]MDD5651890.1 ferredoxin [Candidatus Moranbacteria bacterium]MDX9855351.1 ferredoxin [Candidatus Moranbacteria bacterium]